MSFFAELKRRNVFRVGFAYAVAAWVLLQMFDVIGEILELPAWGGKLILAMLVIGFFIALIVAWAYELTPEGVKRESEVDRSQSATTQTGRKLNGLIMALLVLAVAYLLFDKFWLQPRLQPETAAAPVMQESAPMGNAAMDEDVAPEAKPIDPRSVAVLPFDNRSSVSEDEFFIDGIHDDLLTTLARIGSLKVISRTSVSRYENTTKSIPEIARELGVATVMEGAVQRAGDTVRVNVQLIDAGTDQHLWAESYDRSLTTENLFAIQSEISDAIARALQTELTADEQRRINERPTENLAAYSAYLRGLRGLARREVGTMREALAEFQRAVELDPDFALAWAGIANTANVLPSWGGLTPEEGSAIAGPAARRAMELAPDLGESHLALAGVLRGDEATEQYRMAIELLPNHAPAYQWYANHLQNRPKDYAEAMALLRKAVELDPLSPIFRHQVARQLLMMGRFAEAEREIRNLVETDPGFFPAVSFMGWAVSAQGRFAEAVAWDRKAGQLDPESPFPRGSQAINLITMQDRARLVALREELAVADDPAAAPLLALVESGIAILDGRVDAAIENIRGQPSVPFVLNTEDALGWLYLYAQNYAAAREVWERANPQFFDPQTWRAAIEQKAAMGCAVGYVMARTGNAEQGRALVDETLAYLKNELPRYVEHAAAQSNRHHCHAIRGEYDETLAVAQTLLDHGHLAFWWDLRSLDYFEPLQGEPRFETLIRRIEDVMAAQRAELDRLEADA
jgi:TolB-like protein/Flp pilus assembly protein TadD